MIFKAICFSPIVEEATEAKIKTVTLLVASMHLSLF